MNNNEKMTMVMVVELVDMLLELILAIRANPELALIIPQTKGRILNSVALKIAIDKEAESSNKENDREVTITDEVIELLNALKH